LNPEFSLTLEETLEVFTTGLDPFDLETAERLCAL